MMPWFDWFWPWRLAPTNLVQPIAPQTSLFSPNIEVNYRGDPAIEREVVSKVAGYGSQLGTLIDALAELAGERSGPAFDKLRALAREVDQIKQSHRGDVAERARKALAALDAADPDALWRLIGEFTTRRT